MTSRSHTPEGIIDAMDHEARYIIRTSRMDLDAFLACDQAERARRWRQFDHSAKWQLVALMIERRGYDWDEASIQHWIGHYDERYALPPVEAAVEGALKRLATESSDAARCAAASGDKDGRTTFRRAATAYTNALIEFRKGVRPELLDSGAYLLPSRRAGEAPHLVRMDGDWVCSCPAGASLHWPIALVIAHEVAYDDLATYGDDGPADDGDDNGTGGASDPLTGLQPGAYVRARVLDAMLERSAARIAELRQAVAAQQPTPAAQPTPADLGRRLTQARRPLMAAYDAETARLASKGELRAELERVQAERAAARACYRVAV